MIKKLLAILISIIICFSIPLSIYAATVSDLEQQQQEAEDKKNEAKEKLDDIKEEQKMK